MFRSNLAILLVVPHWDHIGSEYSRTSAAVATVEEEEEAARCTDDLKEELYVGAVVMEVRPLDKTHGNSSAFPRSVEEDTDSSEANRRRGFAKQQHCHTLKWKKMDVGMASLGKGQS